MDPVGINYQLVRYTYTSSIELSWEICLPGKGAKLCYHRIYDGEAADGGV